MLQEEGKPSLQLPSGLDVGTARGKFARLNYQHSGPGTAPRGQCSFISLRQVTLVTHKVTKMVIAGARLLMNSQASPNTQDCPFAILFGCVSGAGRRGSPRALPDH